MAESVLTNTNANFQAFQQATTYAQQRAQAAENARASIAALIPDAQAAANAKADALVAAGAKADALTAAGAKTNAVAAAALLPDLRAARLAATATAGLIPHSGGDHTTIPAGAGVYRIMTDAEAGQVWERVAGGGVLRRPELEAAAATDVQETRALAQQADTKAGSASMLAEQARTVATVADAASSNLGAANTVIVRDPVRGGVFNRDAAQSGAAIPGVRYQWGGVWFVRQRAGKEWNLRHLDLAGDHGGNAAAAIRALLPFFGTNDRLILPEGPYQFLGGRVDLIGLAGFTLDAYGAEIEIDPAVPVNWANGGLYLWAMTDFTVRGLNIDGRLDVRTPPGGDGGDVNFISNLNICPGCDGGLIEDVYSTRSMMDGVYIGHGNPQTESIVPSIPANWPKFVTLNRVYADYNYRQGMSVTGSYDCAVYGGEFNHTGQLGAGRGTPPQAGIDVESENVAGWVNERLRIVGTVMRGNKGRGLVMDTNSIDCSAQGVSLIDNGQAGVVIAQHAQGCVVQASTIRGNGITDPGDGQAGVYGRRNSLVNNTVQARPGTYGIVGTSTGGSGGRTVSGNILSVLGAHSGARSGPLSIAGDNDVVTGNTIIGGVETAAVTGVLDVRSAGGTVTGNRVIDLAGGNASRPVLIEAATERDNTQSGYTGPVYLDANAKPATPALVASPLGGSDTVTAAAYNQLLEEVRSLRQAVKDGGVTR